MGGDRKFASRDALGDDKDFDEIQLPALGEWVRVRYLSTPELTRLQFLPDLLGFTELVSKFSSGEATETEEEPVDTGALIAENYRYQARVAHLAVTDPDVTDPDALCPSCEFVHPPSLWSPRQTARLDHRDLDAITLVALRAQAAVRAVRPFSKVATPPSSSASAEPGTSTPPTSS